jgi:hypothetical protein
LFTTTVKAQTQICCHHPIFNLISLQSLMLAHSLLSFPFAAVKQLLTPTSFIATSIPANAALQQPTVTALHASW